MTETETQQPPPYLPPEPEIFFRAGPDVDLLISIAPPEAPKHVLEQLGPPPFRKTNFPILGFLTTFYEHVSEHASGPPPAPTSGSDGPADTPAAAPPAENS
jgi:hypothetical protein